MAIKKNSLNLIYFIIVIFLIAGFFVLIYNSEKSLITFDSLVADYNEAKTGSVYDEPTTFGKIVQFFLSGFQVLEFENNSISFQNSGGLNFSKESPAEKNFNLPENISKENFTENINEAANKSVFFSAGIKDSKNKEISAIIEFEDSETGEIKAIYKKEDSQGNFAKITAAILGNQGESFEIPKGKYNVKVNLQNHPIKKIIFENLEIQENVTEFVKIDNPSEFGDFSEIYAIDPSGFLFSSAEVTATAKSKNLYKCGEWDFAFQNCSGNWTKLKELIPGQDYTFILTSQDPGFGETNITSASYSAIVCDTSSCPRNETEKVSLDDHSFAHIKATPQFNNPYMNMSWNNSIPLNSIINSVKFEIEHKVAEGPDAVLNLWNGSGFIQAANLTEPSTMTIEIIDLSSQINTPEKANDILLQYSLKGTGNALIDFARIKINSTEITENFPPANPTPLINSTDGSNKTKQNLNCFSTISDLNLDKLNVTIKWIKNSTEYLSIDYNGSFASGTFFSAFLDSENTTKGDVWSCGIKIFDGEFFSNLTFSQNLIILNTPPITNLASPADGNITTNRTPTFIWNAADDDNDILTYELNVSCYPGCSSDNRYFIGLNNLSNTLTNDLQFLSDNNFYYNWSARAHDGETFGNWAKERRINIQSLLTISLINNSVNFGELKNNETKNTTSGSPEPLVIQNDGNSFLNIGVDAASFFESEPNPTSNYQFKIDNSTEHGAFDWIFSLVDWTNIPAVTTLAIAKLNYLDSRDTARIDLLVRVPDEEPAGNKSSIITFTSTLGE